MIQFHPPSRCLFTRIRIPTLAVPTMILHFLFRKVGTTEMTHRIGHEMLLRWRSCPRPHGWTPLRVTLNKAQTPDLMQSPNSAHPDHISPHPDQVRHPVRDMATLLRQVQAMARPRVADDSLQLVAAIPLTSVPFLHRATTWAEERRRRQ